MDIFFLFWGTLKREICYTKWPIFRFTIIEAIYTKPACNLTSYTATKNASGMVEIDMWIDRPSEEQDAATEKK